MAAQSPPHTLLQQLLKGESFKCRLLLTLEHIYNISTQKIPTLHHLGAGNILGHFFYISHNFKSDVERFHFCVCVHKRIAVCVISSCFVQILFMSWWQTSRPHPKHEARIKIRRNKIVLSKNSSLCNVCKLFNTSIKKFKRRGWDRVKPGFEH